MSDVTQRILVGDVMDGLASLPDESVQCVVTSPPYWGLRDYSTDGQIGLEKTPTEYVEKMVVVFREVRRVLHKDGCIFVNLGDSYAGGKRGGNPADSEFQKQATNKGSLTAPSVIPDGLKPKDLVGIPWRVAFALQADGWHLRSAMPWVKRSAMPESCRDRPSSALEYVFLLTRGPRYYWDLDAVRKEAAPATIERDKHSRILAKDGPQAVRHDHETQVNPAGRQWRNSDLFYESIDPAHGMIFAGDEPVGLDVTSVGFADAHFAAYPEALVKPCILAGTSERGACPKCGAPWRRVVEKTDTGKTQKMPDGYATHAGSHGSFHRDGRESGQTGIPVLVNVTIGWQPTCECKFFRLRDDVPAPIIDELRTSGLV